MNEPEPVLHIVRIVYDDGSISAWAFRTRGAAIRWCSHNSLRPIVVALHNSGWGVANNHGTVYLETITRQELDGHARARRDSGHRWLVYFDTLERETLERQVRVHVEIVP